MCTKVEELMDMVKDVLENDMKVEAVLDTVNVAAAAMMFFEEQLTKVWEDGDVPEDIILSLKRLADSIPQRCVEEEHILGDAEIKYLFNETVISMFDNHPELAQVGCSMSDEDKERLEYYGYDVSSYVRADKSSGIIEAIEELTKAMKNKTKAAEDIALLMEIKEGIDDMDIAGVCFLIFLVTEQGYSFKKALANVTRIESDCTE